MLNFRGFRCSVCSQRYAPDEVTYTCPMDGGNLDVVLDYAAIARTWTPASIAVNPDLSIWRYQPLLPVQAPPPNSGPLRTVGGTPLYRADRLAQRLGLNHIWIKDDGRLPTSSFKDRASAVVVVRALEKGIDRIITASTGNAGVALAGMAAAAGLQAVILVPETAPQAKIAQLLIFGAQLLLIRGNYDVAFDLTLTASREFGWYCRNTGYNPFTAEGKKTAAFEICEQLTNLQVSESVNEQVGKPVVSHALSTTELAAEPSENQQWRVPDRVFVPVGDGNIISGIHKGFKELHALGWIDPLRVPKLMGVQAEGAAAVANAFKTGTEEIIPVDANTLADSISSDMPRDGLRALRAATQTGGAYMTVSDEEILAATVTLARQAAVFAEPAAAAAYAGLVKCAEAGELDPDEQLVLLITGNGLNDVKAAMQATGTAPCIEPTLEAVQEALYSV